MSNMHERKPLTPFEYINKLRSLCIPKEYRIGGCIFGTKHNNVQKGIYAEYIQILDIVYTSFSLN